MSHIRSLCFDALEERKLLSTAHGAAHARAAGALVHAKTAVATTPLMLDGTLAVDNNGATMNTDAEGDEMTSTPVTGQLGALGKVHGVWNESADAYGDYLGPDTLQLRTAKGTFIVQFSEEDISAVHHLADGAKQDVEPELASEGTGAYAGARESGTIELTTNSARTAIVSMTLSSQGT